MKSGIRIFKTTDALHRWLEQHHDTAQELWIGFYNKQSGKTSVSYKDAVDEALCFGWIDGIRKKVDDDTYTNRFTPRKKKSIWSNINTKRAEELIECRRMQPAGLAAFNQRDEKNAGVYSFEKMDQKLTPAFEKKFRARKKAWAY